MKNLLAFLAAAVLVFVGVGWYLDWFQVFNGPAPSRPPRLQRRSRHRQNQADVKKGEEKVAEAIEKARKDAAAQGGGGQEGGERGQKRFDGWETLDWSKSEK